MDIGTSKIGFMTCTFIWYYEMFLCFPNSEVVIIMKLGINKTGI